jgi:general secretion pathway protein A
MYAQFFGLKQAPFSIAPDPRYLFMSERHREALAHLLYGVGGGGGFVVLTGEIGAGKTTVCRCFLEQIPRRTNVAYIFNPKLTVAELLKSICDEFRIPYEHQGPGQATIKDYVDPLNEFLLKTHAVGQNNVLIIDEAQNLSPDVLEQLRLLTNLETSERKLLQIMLIGQPELRTMLARPELEQLAQRVIAHFHLEALSEDETSQYIQHRLSVAGLKRGKLFDSKAVRRIHQLTRGVPRRINLLCDRALLGAYATNRQRVNVEIIEKAALEVFQAPKGPALLPPRPASSRRSQHPPGKGWRSRWQPWQTWLSVGGVLAVVAALGAFGWVPWFQGGATRHAGKQAAAQLAKPASGAASAASAAAHKASAPPPPPLVTAAQLADGGYQKEREAWQDLAALWGVELGATGEPCNQAYAHRLACFRGEGGLSEIRQLGRPVILMLRDSQDRPFYALLLALGPQEATLGVGEGRQRVSLEALGRLWRGSFATVWQMPPGYRSKVLKGQRGEVVDWLAAQLAKIDHEAAPQGQQVFDAAMASKVYAFQMAQGLKPDGVVGASTVMLINRVAGVNEPRLQIDKASAS